MPELSDHEWNEAGGQGFLRHQGPVPEPFKAVSRALQQKARELHIPDFTIQPADAYVAAKGMKDGKEAAPALNIYRYNQFLVTPKLLELLGKEASVALLSRAMEYSYAHKLEVKNHVLGYVLAGAEIPFGMAALHSTGKALKEKPVNRRDFLSAAIATVAAGSTAHHIGSEMNKNREMIDQLKSDGMPAASREALAKVTGWYKKRGLSQEGWAQGI